MSGYCGQGSGAAAFPARSYSWPELRREAEGMRAQGTPRRAVIDRLRARAARGEASPPSRTTMYRWFGEARWRTRAGPAAAAPVAA